MKLLNLTINNFRSLESASFNIEEVKDGSYTFTLIGNNESGKSSFLKAISLVDKDNALYPTDFYDDKKPIEIFLSYELEPYDKKELKKELMDKGFEKDAISKILIDNIDVCVNFEPVHNTEKETFDRIYFKNKTLSGYTLNGTEPIKKDSDLAQEDIDLDEYFESNFEQYFWNKSHYITFWKSDAQHLISDKINLDIFAATPRETSIPLKNCFSLAGIDAANIPAEISKIKDNPAVVNNLQEKLGDRVTSHIKKVWPGHPIKIKFQIDNMMLSFLIVDDEVKYSSKTTAQRSDGFRQFISFLLTISAENSSNQLSRTLLLLDEPETHLHPQAQEYLKDELIKITRNKNNNILFFATHSNYMIDKDHIDRCYRVQKQGNKKTKLKKIEGETSTYSEVNYEVFGIASSDYHNELYGYLQDRDKSKLDVLDKIKTWKNKKPAIPVKFPYQLI